MSRRAFLQAVTGSIALGMANSVHAFTQEILKPASKPAVYVHPSLATSSKLPVGTALACLIDCSGSIDDEEFRLQCDATADALASSDFQDAIFFSLGPQSIAFCLIGFGSDSHIMVPWVDLRRRDEKKFIELAHEVRSAPRPENGMTRHVMGLDRAREMFVNCPWESRLKIVDMITDGTNDSGTEHLKSAVHALATDLSATVNALIIESSKTSTSLVEYAWKNIVTQTEPTYYRPDQSALDPGFVKDIAYEDSEQSAGGINRYRDAVKAAIRSKMIFETSRYNPEQSRRLATLYRKNHDIPLPRGY